MKLFSIFFLRSGKTVPGSPREVIAGIAADTCSLLSSHPPGVRAPALNPLFDLLAVQILFESLLRQFDHFVVGRKSQRNQLVLPSADKSACAHSVGASACNRNRSSSRITRSCTFSGYDRIRNSATNAASATTTSHTE